MYLFVVYSWEFLVVVIKNYVMNGVRGENWVNEEFDFADILRCSFKFSELLI